MQPPASLARLPESPQQAPHPRLREVVARHLATPDRTPIPDHTRAAFERLAADPRRDGRPLVFDSGCGTGLATALIARARPDALVVGIDRSQLRLDRELPLAWPANALRLRAEVGAFWRLAAEAGWRLDAHWLLHPNPSPKPGQLRRRWHAHPAFPALLALGGALELRSNWRIYAEEFSIALGMAGVPALVESAVETPIESAFERKYRAAGHPIWRVAVDLDPLDAGRARGAARESLTARPGRSPA
jgi:tRNA G46 methylase TrmB